MRRSGEIYRSGPLGVIDEGVAVKSSRTSDWSSIGLAAAVALIAGFAASVVPFGPAVASFFLAIMTVSICVGALKLMHLVRRLRP